MRYEIITTYYERPEWMGEVMKALIDSAKNTKSTIHHTILDDFSIEHPISGIIKNTTPLPNYTIHLYRNPINLGRQKYYHTMNCIMKMIRECDYTISLQDDTVACEGFFDILDDLLKDKPRIMLNIHYDIARLKRFRYNVIPWIDGAGSVIPYDYLKEIDFCVPRIPKEHTKYSSGYWKFLNQKIYKTIKNAKVGMTNYSLLYHKGHTDSKLNPLDRSRLKMKTGRWIGDYKNPKVEIVTHRIRNIPAKEPATIVFKQDGMGNIIMGLPVLFNAIKKFNDITVSSYGRESANTILKLICKHHKIKFVGRRKGTSRNLIKIDKSNDRGNEVSQYAQSCKQVYPGKHFNEDDFIRSVTPIDWREYRDTPFTPSYDIIVCDGTYNSKMWTLKRYRRWPEVVKGLRGYKIASIGLRNEFIPGAENLTGLSIEESGDLISKCKLFIGNNTGFYHLANLIGKPNVMVNTFTKREIYHHPVFHRFCRLIMFDCPPCQRDRDRMLSCGTHPCTKFNPDIIIKIAKEMLCGT